MSEVQGTDRYTYLFCTRLKKVQIGTTPFRGVPFVPRLKTKLGRVAMTDFFSLEQQLQ